MPTHAHLCCVLTVFCCAQQQAGMDGASFAKLCRDSGLLGGKLNSTAVDIAFSKAKGKVCWQRKLVMFCVDFGLTASV